jgi:hypothetical protein
MTGVAAAGEACSPAHERMDQVHILRPTSSALLKKNQLRLQMLPVELLRKAMAQTAADILVDVLQERSVDTVFALLGKSDGTARGGHLVEAVVRVEIILTETPTYLRRRFDRESGLPLIDAGGQST